MEGFLFRHMKIYTVVCSCGCWVCQRSERAGLAAPINGQLANWTTRMSSGQTERERVPKCQVGFNVESNNYTHGKGHTAPGTTTHGRPEQLASVLSICKINNALRRKRKTEQVS